MQPQRKLRYRDGWSTTLLLGLVTMKTRDFSKVKGLGGKIKKGRLGGRELDQNRFKYPDSGRCETEAGEDRGR